MLGLKPLISSSLKRIYSLFCLVANILLLWRLPIVLASLTLLLLNTLWVASMRHFEVAQLHRLLHSG